MEFKKQNKLLNIRKKQTLKYIENKLVVTSGKKEGEGAIYWYGMKRCKPLYTRCYCAMILHNMENSANIF